MSLSNYVVALKGISQTLRNRKKPTSAESLELFCNRIKPHVQELNASRHILKIDAKSSASAMLKKIAT